MKRLLPFLLGFAGGGVVGFVVMPFGGEELAQTLHPHIRPILYANRDPMAGLLFDPLVVILLFALVGAAVGTACQRLLGRRHEKQG
jgi:hypothetical protein